MRLYAVPLTSSVNQEVMKKRVAVQTTVRFCARSVQINFDELEAERFKWKN